MLIRCDKINLVLNWEKYHFMVKEGIVLGHHISKKGHEIDKAKIEVLENFPPPLNIKGTRRCIGQMDSTRGLSNISLKNTKHICQLLQHEVTYHFNEERLKCFMILKKALIYVPIIIAPVWSKPFELMCEASDFSIRVVLG